MLQLADRGLSESSLVNAVRGLGFASSNLYFQRLNLLLDTQQAEAAYPVLVHRLRRLRRAKTVKRWFP